MNATHDSGSARSLWVWSERLHGPLPLLTVLLCLVTGFVDAVSFISFGRVFVANMTGNIVLLGFAIAGAKGISSGASLAALGAFLVGAFLGGRLAERAGRHRGRHVGAAAASSGPLLAIALLISILVGHTGDERYALIVPMGMAMGIQNATARRIAVPDVSTTVVTTTITALAADFRSGSGLDSVTARRLVAVVAIFLGALFGGLLVVEVSVTSALAGALAVMALVWLVARRYSSEEAEWTRPPGS